jgi:DNA-binding response OmpR family regulator
MIDRDLRWGPQMPDAPLSILLIEADAVTEELYKRELGRRYRVLTCRDEAETLQLLRTEDIRAVVLEPALSDGAGWRLMESMCSVQPDTPLPFILCSASDERKRGMDLGAAAYLVKPVLPQTLLDTLQKVLQG